MQIFEYIMAAQFIPTPKYFIIALIIGIFVTIILNCRYHEKRKSVAIGMMVGYLLLILSSTIFMREVTDKNYELMPLWSYVQIMKGEYSFLYEDLLNVIMFMPVGFLLGIIFGKNEDAKMTSRFFRSINCKMTIKQVIIIGLLLSAVIEVLQFITKRGLFEFDDILHNTLGCVIGYAIKMKRLRG